MFVKNTWGFGGRAPCPSLGSAPGRETVAAIVAKLSK